MNMPSDLRDKPLTRDVIASASAIVRPPQLPVRSRHNSNTSGQNAQNSSRKLR